MELLGTTLHQAVPGTKMAALPSAPGPGCARHEDGGASVATQPGAPVPGTKMAAPPSGDARKRRPLPVPKMAARPGPGAGAGVGAVAAMATRGAEAEALFEAHTAAELRAVERRLRAGIEQKREELRQMVGERYRDLIEAADTIAEMRRSAERLLGAVRGLQRGGAARPGPAGTVRPAAQQSFYAAAAQLKLLLEVPERVWGAVEGGRYLPAARLHLLGAHLRRQLQLDAPRARCSPILARFPILLRQVAAASHLRSTILQESKALLRCPTGSDQAVAEALCAIMLLEDSSPRQALADFLLARKLAIQQLLNQPHHGAGIKAQVCSLMELLGTTLYQAHALFYTVPEGMAPEPALPCGLLFSTLESSTGQNPAGRGGVLEEDLKLSSWFKYLPESVVEFQPALRTLAHPISQEYLRETLQQWINMCSDDIRTGVRTLLVYVKSMKGLAGIRDAVWELLSSESSSHNWEAVCRRLLDRPVSFWEELLQQLFLDRLQTLTKEGFDSISSSSKQLLAVALQELEVKAGSGALSKQIQLEHNVALFLWSESPGDLPGDAAWVSVGQRGPFARSGLATKAQALTPCVQSFCSTLDSKLKARLEDVLSYLPGDDSVPKEPAAPPRSAFDRFADAGTVQGLLRDRCVACVRHLLGCVQEQLQSAQSQLDPPGDARLNAVLFMARLCQALPQLCPHLQRCVLGQAGGAESAPKEPRSAKKLGKGKAQEVPPELAKWQEVKAELLQQSLVAYQLWSSAVTKGLVQCFTHTLLLDTAGSVLATATNWDEIEIQEETESGSSVTSKIRLPVQRPDSFPLTQSRALQLLYDLRYLSIILTAKSEDTKPSRIKQDSGIEKVIDFLEGHIDPFDLDVFTPHLNSNLNRLVQRTSVLFGLLTGTENQYTSRAGVLSSQELHNILPLASSQIRFGLLPLSMSSSRKSKSTARSTERVQGPAAAAVLPREDEAARPGSLFRQLITDDEDTVAPSLFKLGWLSGMTK
ncbi:conserved oligomeric Golgi complex subunit 1 isoform X3 [Vidua chalybeata]|uniref:conserved oligomeric Golgi complex subunit 1 isoform X3 n=1 Tax=Vidua chalybeata TaxID=81927 RepID=UPI0023A8060B|nr:conserved oligomeric Golgi complex subunit 1 isoform X3 [Vidua chalybeata]